MTKEGCGNTAFDPKKYESDIGKLGKQLGMDQECIKASKNKFKTHQSNMKAQGKVSAPFGMGGAEMSASASTSGTEMEDEKFEKGCGNFLMNVTEIHNTTNNIKCNVNNNSREMSVNAKMGATILIKTKVSEQTKREANAQFAKSQERLERMLMRPNISDKQFEMFSKMLESKERALAMQLGSITMKNSTFKNKITGKIRVMNKSQIKNSTEIKEDFKRAAKAAVSAKLKEVAGTNALSPNTKQVINTKINNNEQNITKKIQNIVDNTDVQVGADGNITVISSSSIDMDGVVMDQDIGLTVAVEAIQASSMDMALDIASEMIDEASSESVTDIETAGLNDLAKELADGNAKAIQETGSGNSSGSGNSTMSMIAGVIVICVLAAVFYSKTQSRVGPYPGPYPPGPYPPGPYPPRPPIPPRQPIPSQSYFPGQQAPPRQPVPGQTVPSQQLPGFSPQVPIPSQPVPSQPVPRQQLPGFSPQVPIPSQPVPRQ